MSPSTLVLADNLTGAAESAAAFGRVADAWVVLGTDPSTDRFPDGDLVALDTHTRYAEPQRAAEVLRRCASAYPNTHVYKKIDSMLRGNIAVEVAAVLEAVDAATDSSGTTIALVAPAFPAIGCTTVDGVVRVRRDALPAGRGDGDLPALFGRGGVSTGLVDLSTLRGGPLS